MDPSLHFSGTLSGAPVRQAGSREGPRFPPALARVPSPLSLLFLEHFCFSPTADPVLVTSSLQELPHL